VERVTSLLPRRAAVRLVLAVATLSLLATTVPAASVDAATERIPDLRSAKITDMRIVRTASGRRLLRFTSMMWNKGTGPFELLSTRANRKSPWDVDQIIYDSAGGHRRVQTPAQLRFAGDGHDHWHVRRMMSYHLWGGGGTFQDRKIGFCFFDTNLIRPDLPRSPSRIVYRQSKCGGKKSLRTRTGLSVGWGDKYPWNFAYQWIDITGIKGGTYTLRAVVDLYDYFEESIETNNCDWARIKFGSSGRKVKVLARGKGCVDDYSSSAYSTQIGWAIERGVIRLCDADMFCTNNRVKRAHMAAYVDRVMDLPATDVDHFDDDDGSTYEAAINRVAEAGIMRGCAARAFCGGKYLKRGPTATVLARALALPPADQDYFDDDDGTTHEAAINALAAAGITMRCGPRRFCPTRQLKRGEAAAFLYRGFAES
jgi:hypothetical protein